MIGLNTLALKISQLKILSRWVVLSIDSLLSGLSTFIVLAFITEYIYDLGGNMALMLWAMSMMLSVMIFLLSGIHMNIIRHFSVASILQLLGVAVLKELCLVTIIYIRSWAVPINLLFVFASLDAFFTVFALVGVRVGMVSFYNFALAKLGSDRKFVLLYGVGPSSVALVPTLASSSQFKLIGFVNPDSSLCSYRLAELPVYHFQTSGKLADFKQTSLLHGIIFPDAESLRAEVDRLVVYAQNAGLKSYIAPPVDELENFKARRSAIKEIQIEDLLGRGEIQIDMQAIAKSFAGKTILVTGAAGSIGSELCRQVVGFGVGRLILFDNAETPLHNIRLELETSFPHLDFVPFVGDVRSAQRLKVVFEQYRPDIVFHAAAYKHVPLMEENPCEAVRVNVIGTRLVADFCVEYSVDKMVMVSTDKAVNPTNVMGASKRLAEIYVQGLGLAIERGEISGRTKFVTTRFGNVLGSNGSVIPHFREQISRGGPVTVTHPQITRYFMTIPEACRLVMDAASMSSGNQIFVFDMGTPIKIADLARRMIEMAGLVLGEDIEIAYTGLRPGEKLYEELLSNEENTMPTVHEKIRIAKVREYIYVDISKKIHYLDTVSYEGRVEDTVRAMKDIVPEFISNNSIFEQLDAAYVSQRP